MWRLDDAASNLSVLTSGALSGAAQMNTRFQSLWATDAGGNDDCTTAAPFLLVPTATHGAETVGLAVFRERSSSSAVADDRAAPCYASIGRYHFCGASGALLVLARPLPLEPDGAEQFLALVRVANGGIWAAAAARPTVHVLWWPPVRGRVGAAVPLGGAVGEKLACVVDAELFRQGRFGESILVASYAESAAREVCSACEDARLALCHVDATLGLPASVGSWMGTACDCRDGLQPVTAPSDAVQVQHRNMRVSHAGTWLASADVLTRVPGGNGRVCAVTQALRVTLDFSFDLCVVELLKNLAITRSMTTVCLPKQIMPSAVLSDEFLLEDFTCVVDNVLDASPGEVADAVADDCIVKSVEEEWFAEDYSTLPPPQLDASQVYTAMPVLPEPLVTVARGQAPVPVLKDEDAGAEKAQQLKDRKQRNREAAARSNARRKRHNEQLRAALRDARKRAVELQTAELELRTENVRLRTVWAKTQAKSQIRSSSAMT
jgi:hypothetical protein